MKAGTARVETRGAAVPFGGLATGGGGAGAAYTDFKDFCCPEYLTTMVQLVQRNWQQNQGVDGTVMVKFTITRDGAHPRRRRSRSKARRSSIWPRSAR